MTDEIPDDYDRDDGWSDSKGVEMCPDCQVIFSPNGGYTGAVYDQQGRRFEHYSDTDPMGGPFFCPDCWELLDANKKQAEHQTLGEF